MSLGAALHMRTKTGFRPRSRQSRWRPRNRSDRRAWWSGRRHGCRDRFSGVPDGAVCAELQALRASAGLCWPRDSPRVDHGPRAGIRARRDLAAARDRGPALLDPGVRRDDASWGTRGRHAGWLRWLFKGFPLSREW